MEIIETHDLGILWARRVRQSGYFTLKFSLKVICNLSLRFCVDFNLPYRLNQLFCSQIGLESNHTHQSKKKGGENFPLKDFVCGPVCWAKMVQFWKPCKQAYWPSPECREPFSMLPRHALSSFMVWNAGIGPWWAATAEILKSHQL